MHSPKEQAPSKGPAYALSIEEKVTGLLAVKWRASAWEHWRPVFRQARTAVRAIDILGGLLFADSRQKTLTSSILARQEDQRDSWDADYAVFRDSVWSMDDLFHGVFVASLPLLPADGPIVVAIDDTAIPKTGVKPKKDRAENRKFEEGLGRWVHAPLLPAWQTPALQWGHMVFHGGLVIPTRENGRATFVTLAFEVVPGATDKQKASKRKKKRGNDTDSPDSSSDKTLPKSSPRRRRGRPSKAEIAARLESGAGTVETPLKTTDIAVRFIRRVRKWLDEAGLDNRLLLVVGDGSYCNGTVIRGLPNRTTFVGRTRPDSALRLPGRERPDGTYFYGEKIPNLREVLRNPELPSTTADLWVGGESRPLKIKVLPHVYRPTSTRGVRLQAVMLIPQLYGPRGHRTYSHEAYLLTTDSRTPVEVLVQGYLDRWSIEVAHRDLKCQLGVGEAQVSNPDAIRKIHSALAAAWALLQVATLQSVGAIRTDAVFGKPPRWRVANREWRKKKRLAEGKAAPVVRPSAIDILALFRRSYRLNWTRRQVPFRL